MITIYGLKKENETFDAIRWVGQTQDMAKRLYAHKYSRSTNKHKNNWVLSANKKIDMITLEVVPAKEQAREILHLINSGVKEKDIAAKFFCCRKVINNIKNKVSYTEVTT